MLTLECTGCGKKIGVKVEFAGKRVRCPKCAVVVLVPAGAPSAADAPEVSQCADAQTLPPRTTEVDEQVDAAKNPLASGGLAEGQTLPPRPSAEQETVDAPQAEHTTMPGSADSGATLANIPGYEILGELGRGGMGVVYKARQIKLKRTVALKMILAGSHAGEAELARFRTEAEAIARVKHTNIIQIYEVGEHEGKPYFALEYCSGGSLAQKADGTPMKPHDAARIVEKLARGIEAAHQESIIHRDLKPANVLLLKNGTPKITDFGLAKKLDDAGQTQSGAIMGTPSYMAPEQASGQTKKLGPPADIYALGAILYELLTGRPPFKAATPLDTIMQVVMDEPMPPSALQKKTPLDLETICLKCLEKDAAKRYASAKALADDLARYQRGEPIQARPVGRVERVVKWVKRRPMVAALLAAVAFVAMLGLGSFGWAFSQTLVARDQALDEKKIAQDALVETEKARKAEKEKAEAEKRATEQTKLALQEVEAGKRDLEKALKVSEFERAKAQSVAYSFQIDAARQAIDRGRYDEGRELLYRCDPNLCSWEYDNLLRRTMRLQLACMADNPVRGVAFSPNGARIVSAGGQHAKPGEVKVWDAQTGRELLDLKGHAEMALCVALNHNGTRIATGSQDKTLKIWDAQTGNLLLTMDKHTASVQSVAFSPDGKRIASASGEVIPGSKGEKRTGGEIVVWDVEFGKVIHTLKAHADGVLSVAINFDGTRLISGSKDRSVSIWDMQSGKEVHKFNNLPAEVRSVAISAKGALIAAAIWDYGKTTPLIQLWDARTYQSIHTIRSPSSAIVSVAASPDEQWVIAAEGNGVARVWSARTGQEVQTFRTTRSLHLASAAISPDGSRVALAGSFSSWGILEVWDARPGTDAYVWNPGDGIQSVVSANLQRICLHDALKQELKVFDLASRRELYTRKSTGYFGSVQLSPDGNRLAWIETPKGSAGQTKSTMHVVELTTGKEVMQPKELEHQSFRPLFGPDGQVLIIVENNSKRKQYNLLALDIASGQVLWTLKDHQYGETSGSFSADGKRVIIYEGGKEQIVKLLDLRTGGEAFRLDKFEISRSSCLFSPDGKWLLTSSKQSTRIRDAESGREVASIDEQDVFGFCFSPDGKRVAAQVGFPPGTLKVWDAETGRPILALPGNSSYLSGIAFSQDGKRLVASDKNQVRFWDAVTGQEVFALKSDMVGNVTSQTSPDGNRILMRSGKALVVFDAREGDHSFTFRAHSGGAYEAVFARDGKRIVSRGRDGVKVWDRLSGAQLPSAQGHDEIKGLKALVIGTNAHDPEFSRFISKETNRTVLRDFPTGREVLEIKDVKWAGFDSRGVHLFAVGNDNSVRLLDPVSGNETGGLAGHVHTATGAALSPDGKRIVTWAFGKSERKISEPGEVKLFDALTRKELHTLHKGFVKHVAFSPDGKRIVTAAIVKTTGGPSEAKVWDADTGAEIFTMPAGMFVHSAAYSPEGRLILIWDGSRHTAKMCDAATGKELYSVTCSCQPEFSPDGTRLVCAGFDHRLRVLDPGTGRELLILQGHADFVHSVAFSPDGNRIVSTSADQTIKLWDVQTGK